MPGIPPVRVTNSEGDFNQIPVFEMEFSGATLVKLSPTRTQISFTGATANTSAVIYAPTGGEYITYTSNATLNAERVLAASNNVTVTNVSPYVYLSATTADITGKQDSLNIPIVVGSGGTGRTTAGSATTIVGINTSGAVYDYFQFIASNNMTINRTGTAFFLEANTGSGGSSVVYAPTGGPYIGFATDGTLSAEKILVGSNNAVVTTNATQVVVSVLTNEAAAGAVYAATGNTYAVISDAADLTSEYRIITSGNSVSIDTTGNLLVFNATTQDITGKQDSIAIPVVVGSGGSGLAVAGSATSFIGMNSSGAVYDYYTLTGGDNATVARTGTSYTVSATTADITGKQDSVTFPLVVSSGGTGLSAVGSATALVGGNSSDTTELDYYSLVASNNLTINRVGTTYFFEANTGTGAASSVVYAPSGGGYVVMETDATGTNTNEFLLQASNATVNINTAAGAVYISANTSSGAGGGTSVVRLPMALLTVEVDSGNAYWEARSGGASLDEAYLTFADSGQAEATFWTKIPSNLNTTPAWNIEIDSKGETNGSTSVVLDVHAISVAAGESANGAGTALVSAGSFGLNAPGIITTSTMSATNFDGTLATSATDYVKVRVRRYGQSDPLNSNWNVLSVNLKATVDT